MRTDPLFGDLAALRVRMLLWTSRFTRNRADAEDLVQMAMLRMFAGRHLFDPAAGGVDQWAQVVLRNTWLDERKRPRREFVSLEDVLLVAPDDPFMAVYCRQVCRIALQFDAAMLLAEPDTETATQRSQRRRARLRVERVAA